MTVKEEMVIAGKIHGTHGVRGDLKIEVFPPNFKLPNILYIKDKEGNFIPLEVEAYSKKKGLIKFKGYDDLEKAKKLKHRYFYVEASKLPKLGKDTFYEYQIIDSDVIYNDKVVGKVVKIDDRLSTAYLIIKCTDDKIRHLPFIKEFVKNIDVENKKVYIHPPEGWFSL
ncbi:16S rRNA processing protein RimM [Persephonella hydrogeniphila]|uniref:Ribosome maturation factor RimM n=1 Tax=Persephonella hydrogeniphila TaxID=198703 RepID=A0A285NA33_9AQUI|nr:ribosome maturation factor RimM [Persephonella hydrogeniphila]SNZ06354.1 16S rRNA processing protein RimM [Persephonella hydrogeniphila]